MRVPVPASLVEHAQAAKPEAQARDAATVILVRNGPGANAGLEAYLLRRQPTMKFAPGMYVFPGGRVDEADRLAEVRWVGDPPAQWAAAFHCDDRTARGLVCAAVRETFEETGVLLAGHDAASVVADTSDPMWQQARIDLEDRKLAFADFLAQRDLVLRADLLGPWSHWITPKFEPRRYDTRFFVAVLPEGQSVGALPGEADRGSWEPLGDVIAAADDGTKNMLPPTRQTCVEIHDLVAERVLDSARERTITPREPQLIEVDGKAFLETDLGPE